MDLYDILSKIALPRPNHSPALEKTSSFIREIFTSWGVPFSVQEFTLRPYEHLIVGCACMLLALVFCYFILRARPLAAFISALAIPVLLFLEFEYFIPVVSPLVTKTGGNIIVSFNAPDAVRELIFAAHYDSKTDFFDHIQRAKIYQLIPHFFALGVLMSLWVCAAKKFQVLNRSVIRRLFTVFPLIFAAYWTLTAFAFGGFVFMSHQSPGAVDNAGSVTALMGLARDIKNGNVRIGKSNVRIILTSGEEVGLQGASAYVGKFIRGGDTTRRLPVSLVNLELTAQNGNLIYWKKDGVFLKFRDADAGLVRRLDAVWKKISGNPIGSGDNITDDALIFMAAGVPSVTIGHPGVPGLGEGYFHGPLDNLKRVNRRNLDLMVTTLGKYIESYGTR